MHSSDDPDEYKPDNAKFFSGRIFTFVVNSKLFDGILYNNNNNNNNNNDDDDDDDDDDDKGRLHKSHT